MYETIGQMNVELHSRWLRLLIDVELSRGHDESALVFAQTTLMLMRTYTVSDDWRFNSTYIVNLYCCKEITTQETNWLDWSDRMNIHKMKHIGFLVDHGIAVSTYTTSEALNTPYRGARWR